MGMVRGIFPSKAQRNAINKVLTPTWRKVIKVADMIADCQVNRGYPNPKYWNEYADIWEKEKAKYNFRKVTLAEFLQNMARKADPVLKQD
jgi:hypothetical protein